MSFIQFSASKVSILIQPLLSAIFQFCFVQKLLRGHSFGRKKVRTQNGNNNNNKPQWHPILRWKSGNSTACKWHESNSHSSNPSNMWIHLWRYRCRYCSFSYYGVWCLLKKEEKKPERIEFCIMSSICVAALPRKMLKFNTT